MKEQDKQPLSSRMIEQVNELSLPPKLPTKLPPITHELTIKQKKNNKSSVNTPVDDAFNITLPIPQQNTVNNDDDLSMKHPDEELLDDSEQKPIELMDITVDAPTYRNKIDVVSTPVPQQTKEEELFFPKKEEKKNDPLLSKIDEIPLLNKFTQEQQPPPKPGNSQSSSNQTKLLDQIKAFIKLKRHGDAERDEISKWNTTETTNPLLPINQMQVGIHEVLDNPLLTNYIKNTDQKNNRGGSKNQKHQKQQTHKKQGGAQRTKKSQQQKYRVHRSKKGTKHTHRCKQKR